MDVDLPPPISFSSLTLEHLPDEILLLILQHLLPPKLSTSYPPRFPTSSSYTDLTNSWTASSRPPWPHPPASPALRAFALTCKRGNRLATPLLYYSINLHQIVSTNRLATTLQQNRSLGSLIKHIHLPNDGLLHGASDRMADKDAWVESLGIIFESSRRLETVFLATRPGGEALQKLMYYATTLDDGGIQTLKRITISSLSFSFPTLGVGSLQAQNLTHLHLIQWIPPTLMERFGTTLIQSLRYLRFSRIPSLTISRLPPIIFDDEKSKSVSAQILFDEMIRISPQPLLLLLRECIEQYSSLQVVLLEVVDLGDLSMPESLTPWQDDEERRRQAQANAASSTSSTNTITSTGGFGAPFDQYSAGNPGQLATLDFPADVPLTSEEGEEWAQRLEETRCEQRLLYWSQIEHFKQLLIRYSREMRSNGRNKDNNNNDNNHNSHNNCNNSDTPTSPIDFRIVAPRTLGWDRNESYIDFHANASACQGDSSDFSAFQDEDVYDLVDRFPHLGHDFGIDQMGRKISYWTGALPRPKP